MKPPKTRRRRLLDEGPIVERAIDERLVHRLEAFSDIVIAFSLSEVAFNLQFPLRATDIFANPIHFIGFLGGFTYLAIIWWMHNRIFAHYFIPDLFGIITNFVLLAAVVLFAWAQELFYKFGFGLTTTILYAATCGTVITLLGILFLRGARDARLPLGEQERVLGIHRGVRLLIVGGVLLLSLMVTPAGAEGIVYSWLLILPAVLIARLAQRRRAQSV